MRKPSGRAAWTVEKRLLNHIAKTDKCWLWLGAMDSKGYGRMRVNKRYKGAHRVAYELWRGEIPEGLVLDHLCKRPDCVNPQHLEPVTQRENLMRGDTLPAKQARITNCPHGHPYSGDNLFYYRGARMCRACSRVRARAYVAKRRTEARLTTTSR